MKVVRLSALRTGRLFILLEAEDYVNEKFL